MSGVFRRTVGRETGVDAGRAAGPDAVGGATGPDAAGGAVGPDAAGPDAAAALEADVTVERGAFRLVARLTAAPGHTVAVMGPSGAGKSTLLGALAGLVALDAGRVSLDDEVLSAPDRQVETARRGTVLLGQDPRLFPHLTARENVAFGPRAAGMPAARARRGAEEWLARVGLAGLGARRPADLSGGQQQRVAIARALAASPRLVLLDEPLTSLDPVTADGIRTMLGEQLAGRTCVVVTHDAVDAVALADRVVVVEDGLVTQTGPVREVLRAPATGFVASLAGVNRVVGIAENGRCRVDGTLAFAGDRGAHVPDGQPVAAVFRPSDVCIGADASTDVDASADADVSTDADASADVDTSTDASADAVARESASRESASGMNRWRASVVRLEQTVGGVRVHTESPAVGVDVATETVAERGLRPGASVELSVPASAVRLLPV